MTAALELIPPAIPLERRRARRIQVSLPVDLETDRGRLLARVTEVSRAGARLDLCNQGATGDAVTLRGNGLTVQARIVWTDDSGTGLWFPHPLDENSFLQLRRTTPD
jgi:hypothetical protein